MFLTIYKNLIRSTVVYGETVWYQFSKKSMQMIKNIQRRATSIVPDLKGLSYKERLRSLNLSTLYIDDKYMTKYKYLKLFLEWLMMIMMRWSLTTHQPFWVISVIKVR